MCGLCKLWSLYNWWCFKQLHDQGLDWIISFVPLQLNDPVLSFLVTDRKLFSKAGIFLSPRSSISEIFLRDTMDSLEMLLNKLLCVNFPLSS